MGRKTGTIQKKPEELEKKQKELDNSWIKLEMEKAAFMLRFQNILEEEDEDLRLQIGESLGELLQLDKEMIVPDIDLVYRVNSRTARQRHLPREVHVKFTKRQDPEDGV